MQIGFTSFISVINIISQIQTYSGESFALPTHSPIMILRDPPGKYIKNPRCAYLFYT